MTRPEPTVVSASFHDARRAAHAAASALPSEPVGLRDAIGRLLTEDVVAVVDVPHYRSSAMDGWAVAGEPPWSLTGSRTLLARQATPIVTGGVVPDGADAVLQSEHGAETGGGILVATTVPVPGRHIRPIATEAARGDVVVAAGTRLNPVHVAVAAGCGHDVLEVRRRPRVRFVFTGDEVDETGVPAEGRVRDSFGVQLPAVLELLGGTAAGGVRIGDTRDAFVGALLTTDADVIVTTGSTGGSSADHLRAALAEIGADLVVDGLAVRPGAPSVLARLPSGAVVVGLPGNPLAAMLTVFTLAHPLVAGLLGADVPPLGRVTAGEDLRGVPGRTVLMPYAIRDGVAIPSRWRGSGMLRGLAAADGVLLCGGPGVAAGSRVDAFALPWVPSAPA